MYGDGAGLWLNVGPTGSKSWVFRYMLHGRARAMGIGALHTVGLAEARERARTARLLLLDGIDPLDARAAQRKQSRLEASVSFRACAERYIAAHRAGWRNAKHAAQWAATLEAYVHPRIGDLSVARVETDHVIGVLEPIWTGKTETAARVRGRVEAVLDYAKTRGWREGENPARWRGHLDNLLPSKAKVKLVQHHPAVPWAEIGDLMTQLSRRQGVAALAVRFLVLTAARSGEVRGARWDEIDLPGAVWTVPATRMKGGREHRVPLAPAAVAILRGVEPLRQGPDDLVFPGLRLGSPLSDTALSRLLPPGVTVHGMRSTFRDWAGETTAFPREVIEMALAHRLGDKAEQAYARGDLFQKRCALMEAWAKFCARPAKAGEAVPDQEEAPARAA